jgi:hypothetical protein
MTIRCSPSGPFRLGRAGGPGRFPDESGGVNHPVGPGGGFRNDNVRQAALSALGVLVGREDFPMNQEVLTTLLARAGDSDSMFAKRPVTPWACWWAGKISR